MLGASQVAGTACLLVFDPAHKFADSEPQGGPRTGEGGVSGSDEVAHGAIDHEKDQRSCS